MNQVIAVYPLFNPYWCDDCHSRRKLATYVHHIYIVISCTSRLSGKDGPRKLCEEPWQKRKLRNINWSYSEEAVGEAKEREEETSNVVSSEVKQEQEQEREELDWGISVITVLESGPQKSSRTLDILNMRVRARRAFW